MGKAVVYVLTNQPVKDATLERHSRPSHGDAQAGAFTNTY